MNLFIDIQRCQEQTEQLRSTQLQLNKAARNLNNAKQRLEQQTCFRQKDALQKAQRDVKELERELVSLAVILQKVADRYERTEEETLTMVRQLPQELLYDGGTVSGSFAYLYPVRPIRYYSHLLKVASSALEKEIWATRLDVKIHLLRLLPAVMPLIMEIPEVWLQQRVLTWLCKYDPEQTSET